MTEVLRENTVQTAASNSLVLTGERKEEQISSVEKDPEKKIQMSANPGVVFIVQCGKIMNGTQAGRDI